MSMGPYMNPSHSLPSLEILMRSTFRSDGGIHGHAKRQMGHSAIVDMNAAPSYHSAQRIKHSSMSMPRISLQQAHLSGPSDVQGSSPSTNESDSHTTLTVLSPISPRSTRCPSLADSVFTTGTCSSPVESGRTTPTSDQGSNHAYTTKHSQKRPDRVYDSGNIRYQRERSNSPPSGHHLHHSLPLHHQPNPLSMSTGHIQHCIDADTPMAQEHHEEKITKQEKRRRNHLNSEKRRRENIKGGMDALVDLVPSCQHIQESKANILKKTREYICYLKNGWKQFQQEAKQLKDEVKRLKDENQELRRLMALQNPQHQVQPENLVYRARS